MLIRKENRVTKESDQSRRKEVIDYIKILVGNYFYGEDETGHLVIKCPAGYFLILVADDLGKGLIALEEIVERGIAPIEDTRAITRLLKKHGIIH